MRNDLNLMWAEEELCNQDIELLAQRSLGQYKTQPLPLKYHNEITRLCREQQLLNNDLNKVSFFLKYISNKIPPIILQY